MAETDLIWMSLLVFLPSVFALVLLFFPRGSEEYMRWWSLLGTAATLVISLFLFIDFSRMLDSHSGQVKDSLLTARADSDAAARTRSDPPESADEIARYP